MSAVGCSGFSLVSSVGSTSSFGLREAWTGVNKSYQYPNPLPSPPSGDVIEVLRLDGYLLVFPKTFQ
jgi:hypothetical protein